MFSDMWDDAYYRVVKFEDLLEKYNINNIEDLELILKHKDFLNSSRIEHYAYNCLYKIRKIKQQNQALKERWEKLKEFVTENFNYFKNSYGIFDDIFADDYRKVLDKMQELEKED